jgi:transglutaminase-like putative cysteine protease
MTRIDVVRRTVAVGLMCLSASAIFFRLFGVVPVVLRIWPVIIMCCVGYALGTAGGKRIQRGTGAAVALVTTLLGSLVLGAMTIANEAGNVSMSSLVGGLVEGIGMILGAVVPAPVNAETITAGILLTAYGALVGCLLVTTFIPASSVAPAVLVFLGGLMLTQGSLWSALPFAAAFVVSVVGALALMPAAKQLNKIEDGAEFATVETAPRPGRKMRFSLVVVGSLIVALGASLLGPLSGIGSIRPPFDPHKKENFRPDTDLDGDDAVSLATKWQTLRREEPIDLFTVTGPNIPRAVNWVINGKFDGVSWSSLTTFDTIGADGIPYEGPGPKLTIEGATGFEIGSNLPGPWLPATYRPTDVTGTPARADKEGTVVAGDDKAADKVYSVDFRALAMKSLAPLATVAPVDQPEFGTLREVPSDFPDDMRFFATAVMAGASAPYDKVQALSDTLTAAPYQEQVDSIQNKLDMASLRDVVLGGRKGTQAQFATAFAMLARSQGFPTRIVVGYALKGKGNSRRVMSTDVLIYPEVWFDKIGWVPFAAGPRDVARGVPVLRKFKPPKDDKPEPSPTPTPTPDEPSPTPTPTPSEEPEPQSQSPAILRYVVPLGLVLLLMAWPVLVAWRRGKVRASYRADDPDSEVSGAWAYTRGATRRMGQPLDDAVSAATYASDPNSPPKLAGLATAVEAAMYAPEHLDPQSAEQAWNLADDVVAGTVKSASFTRKLRWWLVPWMRGKRS